MRDLDPGLRPDLSGDIGEQDALLATVPPEVVRILGEETTLAITAKVDRLTHIDGLAHTRNPFAVHSSSDEMDLSSLKPGLAQIVKDNAEGRWAERCFGLTRGNPTTRENIRLHITVIRLARAGASLKINFKDDSKKAESALAKLDKKINSAVAVHAASSALLDLKAVGSLMDSLTGTAQQIPSEPKVRGLKSVNAAAIAPNTQSGRVLRLGIAHPYSIVSRVRQKLTMRRGDTVAATAGSLQTTEKLEASIGRARGQGTHHHAALSKLLKAEQVREATRLLATIAETQQQLPPIDQLQEHDLHDALAAERYLADRAALAKSMIRAVNPGLLGGDLSLQAKMRQAQSLKLAAALATRHAVENKHAEGRQTIPHLPDAHNILVGGARITPGKGDTEESIRRTAGALQKVFEDRPKSGLIMAMITGNFGTFLQTLKDVKQTPIVNPASHQAGAITELQEFDLETQLIRIRDRYLHDPDKRRELRRILGIKALDHVVGATIIDTLRQLQQQKSAATHQD